MKASQYKELSVEELRAREAELRKSLFNLRSRAATKELENVSRIKAEKHELARVLTMMRQKSVA
jgi:large subunit ribosomal protein L29